MIKFSTWSQTMIDDPGRAIGVLRELRHLVAEYGFDLGRAHWTPGRWNGIDPYECVVNMMATDPARRAALQHLAAAIGGEGRTDSVILTWLEKFGRTQDQVIAWIDEALEKASAEQSAV